ncbi:MAG: NAD-dependent succinate-semialdehyde dehydrogenase [Gammaproteobacteria bacterium]|jgi:succinate-semialdehyde dehydrogenase/glutarate-semialdehyde dehydrogenase
MALTSINPATAEAVWECDAWEDAQIERAVAETALATPVWASTPVTERCRLLHRSAEVLRHNIEELAGLITTEMGKLGREARAEVEKCALACDYYAEHAPAFVADEVIASDAGKSLVAYQPLGTVLAIMPWNFPLWQVFRFAAPALAAGNTALLKHASNVPQCALAIERVFADAGFPAAVFRTLMIGAAQTEQLIADSRVHAVTLTGSEAAGRRVAAAAGAHLKKSVLELGGSDAFIVLADADLEVAVRTAVLSRFQNAGQSCIAAKRFIVVADIADAFLARFKHEVEALQAGDPTDEATTLAPMARGDLRDELHMQVSDSLARGAVAVTGCAPLPHPGYFYAPSILDRVSPGMPAYEQELFGPVAAVIRVGDEAEALTAANASRFGLGASVWTRDSACGERLARELESGACFVNGLVKSDPRLPFGGVKASGYGRELSHHGLREFVNAKTIWVR